MKRIAVLVAALAAPAYADEAPKSESGTAFIERCLKDVTDHRIATFTKQVPEYAATLSEENLRAPAVAKAQTTCPCFLQIIAIDPTMPDVPAEEKVDIFVTYLNALGTDDATAVPAVMRTLTRFCGVRSSVLPPSWVAQ